MKTVGVDGCPAGWIAAWIGPDGTGFDIHSNIDFVTRTDADLTLIDIPIGLPDRGYRACDLAARQVLGKARSRVFLGVRRPLLSLHGAPHAEVTRAAKALDGKGLSIQGHAILSKIAQVDEFMLGALDRQQAIRETHPELIFARLNGGPHLSNKKSKAGRAQRRNLMRRNGFLDIDNWIKGLKREDARPDDLLDACAAALAAREPRKLHCVEEVDSKGLRMEMWY